MAHEGVDASTVSDTHRRLIDLRSDTITRPTAAMRDVMAHAEVGDDVYGEDPEANRLEEEIAGLLGFEAGLFVATGTLANQLGVRLLVPAGKELLCDSQAHIVRAELGAAAVLAGVTTRTWHGPGGRVDPALVEPLIAATGSMYRVSTAAIAVEDTHNFGGGTVQPRRAVDAIIQLAKSHELALHLDGARLWNTHVATNIPLDELAAGFDTVSVCFSKGLGAPVGSMLVSTTERIDEARVWRKRYGGGMRQIGMLAAACRFAVGHHLERLTDDHTRARRIAAALDLDPETVDTNIVVLDVPHAGRFATAVATDGLLVSTVGDRQVRLVTNLEVDDNAIDDAIRILRTHRGT
jgi:threonine aldolase